MARTISLILMVHPPVLWERIQPVTLGPDPHVLYSTAQPKANCDDTSHPTHHTYCSLLLGHHRTYVQLQCGLQLGAAKYLRPSSSIHVYCITITMHLLHDHTVPWGRWTRHGVESILTIPCPHMQRTHDHAATI